MIFEKLFRSFSSESRPPVPFQVVSDLHLEISQQYSSFKIPVCAKYLILGGNTGRLVDYDKYLGFLGKQTAQFEKVFLVLGSHEFYKESFATGLEKAERLEREPSLNGRLVVLHQGRYDIPDSHVTILGCTLWSHVPSNSKAIVEHKIQDFHQIEGWTIDSHNAAHESDSAWLLREIESIRQGNHKAPKQGQRSTLVVTHNAPSVRKTSDPQHEKSRWSCAFATDILPHAAAGVKLWVFGRTHYTTEFKYRGTRVVSNQRGFVFPWLPSKNLKNGNKDGFDVRKVVRLE